MKMILIFRIKRRVQRLAVRFTRDRSGLAAVEFVFIVPLMLTLIFGTIDVSSAVAIDRKVTLVSRTLSDLVSQGATATSTDISNFFKMGGAIMTPYSVTPLTQRVSAVNIDGSKIARVDWSFNGSVNGSSVTVTTGYTKNTIVTIPDVLLVPNTQLIWSEITYTYAPVVGYVMNTVLPLAEQCFTRPRQSNTVVYSTS